MSDIDIARYREVVGHFASGVAVITAMTPDGPAGFTCQSFGSLSLEPVLVTFAAKSQGVSWPKIRHVRHVAVNILEKGQEAVARVFATTGAERFEGLAWREGENRAPIIAGSLAHLEATIVDVVTHGDHDIAIAAVTHLDTADGQPLVYYRGGYGSFIS